MEKEREDSNLPQCWATEGVWGDMSCETLESAVHCENCGIYAQAGKSFFDKPAPASNAAAFTPHPEALEEGGAQTDSFFVFEAGGKFFALEMRRVIKVERLRMVHRIPHRDGRVVKGIANVGGELMMSISLEELFDLENSDGVADARRRMIVCKSSEDRFCFTADSTKGVVRVPRKNILKPDALQRGETGIFAEKTFKLDGRDVLIIDLRLVFLAVAKKHL